MKKGLFFYEGSPNNWYQIFITFINYQDFGFVKRGFFNSIFKFLNIDLSLYSHYAITRIFLLVCLYFFFIYFVINFKKKWNKDYKIEILFLTSLIFLSPGGILTYTRLLIPHIIAVLLYITSIILMFRNQSFITCLIISFLSILGVLQHESYILLCIPLIFSTTLHKKLSYFKLFFLSVPSIIVFFIVITYGNLETTPERLSQQFLKLYPNLYNHDIPNSYTNMNPWNNKPELTCGKFFNLFKNLDLSIFFLLFHLIFVWSIIKKQLFFYKITFIGIFIANLLMFILGTDYGRWASHFVLNTCFLAIYLFNQEPIKYNRKLMLILLSTIFWFLTFNTYYSSFFINIIFLLFVVILFIINKLFYMTFKNYSFRNILIFAIFLFIFWKLIFSKLLWLLLPYFLK